LSQEVFLRVFRTLPSYQPAQGAFPTWLTSVTHNLLVDHYRRTRRDRLTDSIDDEATASQIEDKRSTARTPDKLAEDSEVSAQLQDGLAKLSPDLREAVILRDLQGLDYGEIRTVLQIPEGTVKSRLNRGRIELARILNEMGVRPA
jgi:RNA polymerase sigma-70 factor (ECF subfamily)